MNFSFYRAVVSNSLFINRAREIRAVHISVGSYVETDENELMFPRGIAGDYRPVGKKKKKIENDKVRRKTGRCRPSIMIRIIMV